MKAAVIVFPGSNCDRDMAVALRAAGAEVQMVWHKETALPSGLDLVAIPGGFSFGDYLRCGAIAAKSPIAAAVIAHAGAGGYVLGVCNGFQVLTETGLLPGALMRNAGLKFICRSVPLTVETTQSDFTSAYAVGQPPGAGHDAPSRAGGGSPPWRHLWTSAFPLAGRGASGRLTPPACRAAARRITLHHVRHRHR